MKKPKQASKAPTPTAGQLPSKFEQDYQTVALLIERLGASNAEDASLSALAAYIGQSELQVQRLFSRWAGVSPKRFKQYLTIKDIRQRLKKRASLLDLSLEAGLSSTSRVHDSFINFYAMTPQQARESGKNILIKHGFYPSPFGICHIASTQHGICWLAFIQPISEEEASAELKAEWPDAKFVPDAQSHQDQITSLFHASEQPQALFLHIKGTNFQLKVWDALLKIPNGDCYTYQDIAKSIDKPLAARAVGSAIGKNPISWLIPCHRVIRASGVIGDYRWGSTRKQSLLVWEQAQLHNKTSA